MKKLRKILLWVLVMCLAVPCLGVQSKGTPTPVPTEKADDKDKDKDNDSESGEKQRVVLLDPGHGYLGSSGGGGYNGMNEGDATFKVALALGKELESRGYKVLCSRDLSDTSGQTHNKEHKALYDDETFRKEAIELVVKNGYVKKDATHYYNSNKKSRYFSINQIVDNAARGKLGAKLGADMSFSFHFDSSKTSKVSFVVAGKYTTEYSKDTSLSDTICKVFADGMSKNISGWKVGDTVTDIYTQHMFASVPLAYVEMAGSAEGIKAITNNPETYAKYLADGIDKCYEEGKVQAGGKAVTQETTDDKKETKQNTTTSGGTAQRYDENHYIKEQKDSTEKAVEFAQKDNLSVMERKNLANMNDYMPQEKKADFISFLRAVVSFIGIIITVYCIFLYLVYWFDRVIEQL